MGARSPKTRRSPLRERHVRAALGFARERLRANLIPVLVIGCFAVLIGIEAFLHVEVTPPCLYTTLLGFHCPGCGLTRAFVSMARLDFGAAYATNPLAFVVVAGSLWQVLRSRARVVG